MAVRYPLLLLPVLPSFLFLTFSGFLIFFDLKKERKIPSLEVSSVQPPSSEEIKKGLAKFFPQAPAEEVKPVGEETAKRYKSFKLELVGVALGSRPSAVVLKEGKEILLPLGKEKKGLRLVKVEKNRAWIKVGNETLELRLKKRKAGVRSSPVSAPVGSGNEVVISRREIEAITKDPGIMFRQIRLIPYVKDGKTQGFIFEWVKPGSIFHRIGLRKGDILVSINNQTIKSGEDAFRLLQVLRNENTLKIVVKRGLSNREILVRIK